MNKKGFTLIELLAVIVILGIVVAIAIPGINSVIRNSRQKALNSEAKIIQSAALRKTVGNPSYSFSHINKDNLKSELEADGSKFDYIGIDNNNGKITVTLIKDNMVGYSSNDEEILNAKTYGLHWDGGSNYTRLDDAVGMNATVGTDTLNPHNDFDYADIYKDIIDVEEDGNMFVKIPRFYIKKEVSGNSWTWRISKKKHDEDYYLPAVFQDEERGTLLPFVLVGKYVSSLSSDKTKLESKALSAPHSKDSLVNHRNLARNGGFSLMDIHVVDMIQILFIIEFKTLDSTSIMSGYISAESYANTSNRFTITSVSGNNICLNREPTIFKEYQTIDIAKTSGGRQVGENLQIKKISNNCIEYELISGVSKLKTSISVNDIVYNVTMINGQTDSVLSKSGSIISNTSGKYSMKYRGIENLYGNSYQFVDGININSNIVYVSSNTNNYTHYVYDGDYKKINYTNSTAGGTIKKMGYDKAYPFANFPIEVGGYASTSYKDNYYATASEHIALYGGTWFLGVPSGIFTWNLSSFAPSSHIDNVSRIIMVPN